MNYMELISGDPVDVHVLWRISESTGRLECRDRYADLQCASCGKLDEYAAVRRGVDADVRIRGRRDFVTTDDFFECASSRFQEVIRENGIGGLDFVPVPSKSGYSVMIPTLFVETSLSESGMRAVGSSCARCGRLRETIGSPLVPVDRVPEDPLMIFSPTVRPEKRRDRMTVLLASDLVVDILRKHKLTGIDWNGGGSGVF